MTALESVMLAAAMALGLCYAVAALAAVAHHLVGAARPAPVPPAQSWAVRVDHLIPPALPRPTLLVIDHGRVVRVVPGTDRVAPPREASPEVRRG